MSNPPKAAVSREEERPWRRLQRPGVRALGTARRRTSRALTAGEAAHDFLMSVSGGSSILLLRLRAALP